jgi:hypothetical protein
MPAKGSLLLRFAVLCGIGASMSISAHGQFPESPDTNLFGSDFVKTFDSHSELFGDFHLPLESIAEIVFNPEPLRPPPVPAPKKPAEGAAASGAPALAKPNETQ